MVSLEDKIMHMFVKLASPMACGDHLQHKLKTSFTSASSATNTTSFSTITSFETGLTTTPIDGSNSSRLSKNFGQLLFGTRNDIPVRNEPTLVKEAQANFSRNPNDISKITALVDKSCRMSKLGLFVRNNCGQKERRPSGMQLEFPMSQDVNAIDEEEDKKGHRNNVNSDGPRRCLARKRLDRQPSSTSFLKATGVVFPSTLVDVLAKGCLMKSTEKRGECNEEWGNFR